MKYSIPILALRASAFGSWGFAPRAAKLDERYAPATQSPGSANQWLRLLGLRPSDAVASC